MRLIDDYGKPMPSFYDLTVERRAFVIHHERTHALFRRSRQSPCERFREYSRALGVGDSILALDLVNTRESNAMYRRILLGEY